MDKIPPILVELWEITQNLAEKLLQLAKPIFAVSAKLFSKGLAWLVEIMKSGVDKI